MKGRLENQRLRHSIRETEMSDLPKGCWDSVEAKGGKICILLRRLSS